MHPKSPMSLARLINFVAASYRMIVPAPPGLSINRNQLVERATSTQHERTIIVHALHHISR